MNNNILKQALINFLTIEKINVTLIGELDTRPINGQPASLQKSRLKLVIRVGLDTLIDFEIDHHLHVNHIEMHVDDGTDISGNAFQVVNRILNFCKNHR